MSETQVRRIFIQRDADDIQRLQYNAPEFTRHYPQHNEWLTMAIAEIVAGRRFAFGVYKTTFDEHGNPTISLAGSIILKKEAYTHVAQLKNLYILPEDRRRGLGSSLFQAVEQFCLQNGFTSIETEVPCQESGTVNFLNTMGFFVLNMIESPYLQEDQIYRMQKRLPPRYTGDPFDLFGISCWIFEHLYGFRIVAASEPHIEFVSDLRSEFRKAIHADGILIEGSANVIDTPNPVTSEKIDLFRKHSSKHLLAVTAREFTPDAEKSCRKHRILGVSISTIGAQLRSVFAVELHSFLKENIGGMIVPVNSKYAPRIRVCLTNQGSNQRTMEASTNIAR